MKRLLAKSIMLAGGMTLSSQLLALGLGEMTLNSSLNQPLNAEIEIVDRGGLDARLIFPSLASGADFDRAGVERTAYLSKLKFKIDGDRIRITSNEPAVEPFLNFVVEVNWPAGRILREYTVLLDPPVFKETAAPVFAETPVLTTEPAMQDAGLSSVQNAAVNDSYNRWQNEAAAPGTYKVQPADTLWEIAMSTRPSRQISPQQMMVAIQGMNPDAFIDGNINRLKTHKILQIPNENQVDTISNQSAIAEVKRQNSALMSGGSSNIQSAPQLDATGRNSDTAPKSEVKTLGEVRLLAQSNDETKSIGSSGDPQSDSTQRVAALEDDLAIALENLDRGRRENQELAQRLAALEDQINTLQRLITLKDDQLALLQQTDTAVSEPRPETSAAESDSGVVTDTTLQGEQISSLTENSVSDRSSEKSELPVVNLTERPVSEATDFNFENGAAQTTQKPTDSAATSEIASSDEGSQSNDATEANAANTQPDQLASAKNQVPAQDSAVDSSPASKLDTLPVISPVDQALAFLKEFQTIILGALLGLLVLIGLMVRGRNKKEEDAEAESVTGGDAAVDDIVSMDFDADETVVQNNVSDQLDDFDLHEDDVSSDFTGADEQNIDSDIYNDSDSAAAESFGSEGQQTEDVIGESDIYIAYGKFDQAVDMLEKAIEKEPSRSDLRMKLLEVFVEMDDASEFAKAESSLHALGDDAANDQARELRSRLSNPEASLNPSSSTNSAAADDFAQVDDIFAIDSGEDGDSSNQLEGNIDFNDALELDTQGYAPEGNEIDDLVLDFDIEKPEESSNADSDAINELIVEDFGDLSLDIDLDLEENTVEQENGPAGDIADIDIDVDKLPEDSSSQNPDSLNSESLDSDSLESVPTLDLETDSLDMGSVDLPDLESNLNDSDSNLALENESALEQIQNEVDDKVEDKIEESSHTVDFSTTESVDASLADASMDAAADETESVPLADVQQDDMNATVDFDMDFEVSESTSSESPIIEASDIETPDIETHDIEAIDIATDNTDIGDINLDSADETDAVLVDEAEEEPINLDSLEMGALDTVSGDSTSPAASPEDDNALVESLDVLSTDAEVEFDTEQTLDEISVPESSVDDGVHSELTSNDTAPVSLDVNDADEVNADSSDVDMVDVLMEQPSTVEDDGALADKLVGGIDLDELAASDDEFDFLKGTDECATKLDLARAYIDMEDVEGAKELLQEVVDEGSDDQKKDARELMSNLA